MNLSGYTFTRLTVIERSQNVRTNVAWLCKCECGGFKNISQCDLLSGRTRSCGCLQKEARGSKSRTHGMAGKPIYKIWTGMWNRCTNPNEKCYARYGARGVTVCERWQSFENFYADMGDRPKGTQIDRIKNEKGYEPGNCRWATCKQNQRNRGNNHRLTHNGKTLCIAEWAEELGIPYGRISNRLQKGWPVAVVLSKEKWIKFNNARKTEGAK